jgi:hypothetical protein
MFGSDWPFGPATEEANITPTLRAIGELGLSSEDLAKIQTANATRALGLHPA